MSLISAEVGMTIQIGDKNGRDFLRISAGVSEIDTELDVEAQLAKSRAVIETAWSHLSDDLVAQIALVSPRRR